MKKLLVVTLLASAAAVVSAPRVNAQTAQFTFVPNTIPAVAPGGTIQFSINLVFLTGGNMTDLGGLSYFLQQTSGPTNSAFTITARDITGSQFSDPLITNASLLPNAMNQTNPSFSNSKDLGALYPTVPGLGSNTYFVAQLTLTIAAGASPGVYTIQSTTTGKPSEASDSSGFNTTPISPGTLTVTVVPEPSTYALIGCGGIALAAFAYRRRSMA